MDKDTYYSIRIYQWIRIYITVYVPKFGLPGDSVFGISDSLELSSCWGAGRDIGGSLQPKVQWWHCLGLSAQFLFQTTTQIYRRKGTVSPESFNSETVGDLKRIYVQ